MTSQIERKTLGCHSGSSPSHGLHMSMRQGFVIGRVSVSVSDGLCDWSPSLSIDALRSSLIGCPLCVNERRASLIGRFPGSVAAAAEQGKADR